MSSKKARLIRADNFKYFTYYNVYNGHQSIRSNLLQNYFTSKHKKSYYKLVNNKSLIYGSVYFRYKISSYKITDGTKGVYNLSLSLPIFMTKFLQKSSNVTYSNTLDFHNLKNTVNSFSLFNTFMIANIQLYVPKKDTPNWQHYSKTCWYFPNIYMYKLKHAYEKEDQNKLPYRKNFGFNYRSLKYKL